MICSGAPHSSVLMCGLGADDGLVPAQQQAQAEDVGAAAVQHQEGVGRTEDLTQSRGGPLGPHVVAVGDRIAGVRVRDRAKDRRMDACVIVATEALALCHVHEPRTHGVPAPALTGA